MKVTPIQWLMAIGSLIPLVGVLWTLVMMYVHIQEGISDRQYLHAEVDHLHQDLEDLRNAFNTAQVKDQAVNEKVEFMLPLVLQTMQERME